MQENVNDNGIHNPATVDDFVSSTELMNSI